MVICLSGLCPWQPVHHPEVMSLWSLVWVHSVWLQGPSSHSLTSSHYVPSLKFFHLLLGPLGYIQDPDSTLLPRLAMFLQLFPVLSLFFLLGPLSTCSDLHSTLSLRVINFYSEDEHMQYFPFQGRGYFMLPSFVQLCPCYQQKIQVQFSSSPDVHNLLELQPQGSSALIWPLGAAGL